MLLTVRQTRMAVVAAEAADASIEALSESGLKDGG